MEKRLHQDCRANIAQQQVRAKNANRRKPLKEEALSRMAN